MLLLFGSADTDTGQARTPRPLRDAPYFVQGASHLTCELQRQALTLPNAGSVLSADYTPFAPLRSVSGREWGTLSLPACLTGGGVMVWRVYPY
jgi:hypothetical protein